MDKRTAGPDESTVEVPSRQEGDLVEPWEAISWLISDQVRWFNSTIRSPERMESITRLLGILRVSRMPSVVAHELATRYADVPKMFGECAFSTLVQAALDDLANRPEDEKLVEMGYHQIRAGDRWRDSSGGEYQAVKGRVGGRDVILSYPLSGIDAFRLQPVLPPEMGVFKVISY